ncbi:MAG: hypothetical protein ACI4IA_08340, partial [Acutalibacteraceae bacterium]
KLDGTSREPTSVQLFDLWWTENPPGEIPSTCQAAPFLILSVFTLQPIRPVSKRKECARMEVETISPKKL